MRAEILSPWACRVSCGKKALINTYLWLAIGAAIGGFMAVAVKKGTKTELIESIGVGIFGAFIGGEFIAAQVRGAGPANFGVSLGLAIAGAVTMLVVLGAFRRAIGPLKAGKSRQRDRG